VKLGWGSTVVDGDSLLFNQEMIMDTSDPSCTDFIATFYNNIVAKPRNPIIPSTIL
jgi:hypothetical protein